MQKADLTTRAIAGFVDLLIVIGLARLPDVLGFLSASGYILIRDGLFQGRSIGKKLVGISVASADEEARTAVYRDSIIRNIPLSAVYILFLIPYAGWVLAPAALLIEWLVAIGDDRGMRIGDMLANTRVVQPGPGALETRERAAAQGEDLPSDTSTKQEPITHSDRPEQD